MQTLNDLLSFALALPGIPLFVGRVETESCADAGRIEGEDRRGDVRYSGAIAGVSCGDARQFFMGCSVPSILSISAFADKMQRASVSGNNERVL